MAVNPLLKGFTKTQAKNNALINGIKSDKDKAAQTAKNASSPKKPNTDDLKIQSNKNPHGLSEKALAYLETLRDKFGDMNFIVTRGESHGSKAGGCPSKAYNCFIDADLLERMASCEETAAKYEGVIKNAMVEVDDLKEQIDAKGLGHLIGNIGIKLNADGTWSFSAILKDSIWDAIGGKESGFKNKNIFSDSKEGLLAELERIREAAEAARKANSVEGEKPEDVDFKA
jgi:hypothetical protein